MKKTIAVIACLTSFNVQSGVIDQRDPNFQLGTEHLARYRQALQVAIDELKAADATYAFPGLNVVQHLGQIAPLVESLDLMLSPEEKRLETKVLTPDSIFFTPVPLKEH